MGRLRQLYVAALLLLFLFDETNTQSTVVCPTAIWNSTFRTLAGISGLAASTPTALYYPFRAVFGPNNTLYVADQFNNRIQKFVSGSATGSTVSGLTLAYPNDVYVNSNGVLYILDTNNYRVLRWNNSTVTTLAGGRGNGAGYNQISTSYAMYVDPAENIYVSDHGNHRVVLWSAGNPNISQLVAGGYGAGGASYQLYYPVGIFVDNSGTIYVADQYNHRIQMWYSGAAIGITVAGQSGVSGSWSYQLSYPLAVIYDQYNYLYIADSNNNRVQRWVPGASYGVTIVSSVSFSSPRGLAFDNAGNIILADYNNHRIVSFAVSCPSNATTMSTTPTPQVTVPVCQTAVWSQTFSTIAGSNGNRGTSATLLYNPYSSYIDIYGNLYVADYINHRIQYFQGGSMIATTVAGITSNGGSSYSQLNSPSSLYVDPNGIMYILDTGNCRVLRWNPGDPMGFAVAGNAGCGSALTQITTSYSMFVDTQYNIYISEYSNHRVTLWSPNNMTNAILIAGGYGAGSTAERLNSPWGIYVDSNQAVFIVDRSNQRVQRWDSGALSGVTVAGTNGNAGPWAYQFSNPTAIAADPFGYLYILDTGNSRVQRWWPGANYGTTVISVSMNTPYGLIIDGQGNMVITDTLNYRVLSFPMSCPNATTTTALPPTTPQTSLCRTAQWNSTLNTMAGVYNTAGTSSTLLYYPYGIAFDGYNNLYVADTSNHRIQYYPQGLATANTVAGSSGSYGSTMAQLYNPYGIYIDGNRTMFILDTSNYRVLRWQYGDPLGYVVAGGNGAGSAITQITTSYAMFVDSQSNIYVSEYSNHRVTLWMSTNTSVGIVVAGGYGAGSTPEKLYYPWGVAVDSNRTVYIVDRNNHRVQSWPNGFITGTTVAGSSGNAGPWAYQFSSPTALLLDQYGYLYILDYGNSRIQKWYPGAPYGSTVVSASFSNPCGMQFDRLNNLVVADTYYHRVVSFGVYCPAATTTTTAPPTTPPTPICTTAQWNSTFSILAGITGSRGTSSTLLNYPSDAALDGYGNLYVADTSNHRIHYFPHGTLTGTTIAGNSGSAGSSYSQLNNPYGIYVTGNRTMFILDTSNYRVLRWQLGDPLGYVVAGGNGAGSSLTQITTSYAMFVDSQSNVYVSEYSNHRVTLWMSTNTTAGILAAGGNGAGNTPERFNSPWGIYVDVNGTIYVSDYGNHRVQLWVSGALSGTTVAGTTSNAGPYAYQLNSPTGITLDLFGNIYILDSGNSRIQKWSPGSSYGVTVVAATMSTPFGMHADNQGNLIVTDTYNYRVLSFSMSCPASTTTTTAPPFSTTIPLCATAVWNQTYSTLVGSQGTYGSTSTLLYNPTGIDFDGYGYMYIVDTSNHRIQQYAPGSNVGTTVAGVTGSWGSSRSQLYNPYDIYVTNNQTMFILDTSNYRVLRWQLGDPMGTVVAGGNGNGGGWNQIGVSYGLFVDDQYNVYVSDYGNNRVTKWTPSNTSWGVLVAGGNGAGSTSDKLSNPVDIYVLNNATYIVDQANQRVQKWNFGASLATTVAGTTGSAGSWSYQFNNPTGISIDRYGYIYVLDSGNDRIQKWYPGASYGVTVASTTMSSAFGFQFSKTGSIIISDQSNHRVISFNMYCPPATTTTTAPPFSTSRPLCSTATWNQTFSTLVGSMGTPGSTATLLNYPYDVKYDGYGYMYVVDYNNHRIQRFLPGSNAATTVAGTSGSGGSSLSQLYYPTAIAVTTNQTMYIVDTSNFRVIKWRSGDSMGTVVAGGNGNGGAFTQLGYTYGIFLDRRYNMYLSEQTNHRVTLWLASNTTAGTLVAGGNGAGNTPDKLNSPWGVYVDINGTIYVVDRGNHRVQMWIAGSSIGVTVAGSTSDAGSWSYQFNSPTAIIFDTFGYMYVLDYNNARVQKWYPGATYGTTVAAAAMNLPIGMSFDLFENLVVADTSYHRMISFALVCPSATTTTTAPPFPTTTPLCATATWNQTISIIAGSTSNAGSTATALYYPYYIDFDGYSNLYVVDHQNHRIQKFQPGSSTGTTVAGSTWSAGSTRSQLYYPTSIRVTSNGTMFILDTSNYRILKWQTGDPLGYVVAGGNGNGGAANQIGASYALFVDNNNNIYVSDNANCRVTQWLASNPTTSTTIAGGNGAGNTAEKLNSPWGIHLDSNNGLYVVDRSNHRVQYWPYGASFGTTVAGSTSDPGPWSYQFSSPTSIAMDASGFIYVMDYGNERIQKWYPGATFGVTVAAVNMYNPYGMTIDPSGNIVVADTYYHRVISFGLTCPASTTTAPPPPTQTIVPLCPTATWNQTSTLLAGTTSSSGSTATLLNAPYDMDFDIYGNLYVVDYNNHRIQKFPSGTFSATTVAGYSLGSGSSRSELYYPTAISVTPNNTMFILDRTNYRVLRWRIGDTLGYIVAGGNGNGGAFTQIGVSYGLFVDQTNNVYVSEQSNHRVTMWSAGNTTGTLVAGGNGAGNTPEKLSSPWGIFVDVNATIYVVDRGNHRVQRWGSGINGGQTVAGSTSDPGSWSYQFNNPTSITVDQNGVMYILDYSNDRIQKWSPGATYGITVASGTMSLPIGLKFDRLGNLVVADTGNQRVISYAVTCPASTTTTTLPPPRTPTTLCATAVWNSTASMIAGSTSTAGLSSTLLSSPYDVTFDGYGYMYVADFNNHRIQRFQLGSNVGATVAGFNPSSGGGRSELYNPSSVRVDSSGNMYILDTSNYRVMKWQLGDPIGTVVVNGRGSGSSFTQIGASYGLFIDSQSNIYVSEYGNHRVTLWYRGNNTAGALVAGGNGAGSTPEKLNYPWGIYVDSTNSLYIVDRGNHRVQYWLNGASVATTVAGTTGSSGPWSYQFNTPTNILMDPYGYIYVLDMGNARVQKWLPGAPYGVTVVSATMSSPNGMNFDYSGNLVITDTSNHRILSFGLMCPPTTPTTTLPQTSTQSQVCATAVWNQTTSVIAGVTASAGTTNSLLSSPADIAFDGYRNVYVADRANHRIQKYAPGQTTGTTVAGSSSATSGSANSQLYNPYGIYVTSNQTMFIMDTYNFRVLKWQPGDPMGYVVAGGNGNGGGMNQIGYGYSLFVDPNQNVYVSDNSNHRVTVWYTTNTSVGVLVAGGNGAGNSQEKLNAPWGVYVDSSQTVYVVDRGNHRVQSWGAGSSTGTTVAGSTSNPGSWSYQLNNPTAIVLDQYGYIYVLDYSNDRVQKWFPGNSFGITVISASMSNPIGMKFDLFSNIVIADQSNHRILSFGITCPASTTPSTPPPTVPPTALCSTAAWNATAMIAAGSTSTAGSTATLLYYPMDVTFDIYNYMYVVDQYNHRIQRYPPGSNTGTTVAGFNPSAGSGLSELYYPTAIIVTNNGTMYILDTSNYRVMKWQVGDPIGAVVVNGRGSGSSFTQIGASYGIFVDNQSNIYVSESGNNRVTLWYNGNNTAGTLVAGGNGAGSTADKLNSPWGIYVDSSSSLYVVDRNNHRVQQWGAGAANGITVAGDSNGGSGSLSYQLNSPTAIMLDQYANIYVLDAGNSRVQKWAQGATFGVTVIATTMSTPYGMQWNQLGNLYIADYGYHRILSFALYCPAAATTNAPLAPQTTVPLCSTATWNSASTIIVGATGSAGNAPTFLSSPYDVAFDQYQQMYVADYSNHRIQQYTFGSNVGTTVAGISSSAGSTLGQLNNPSALYIDSNDNMYILDTSNCRVIEWQIGNQLGSVVVNGRGCGASLTQITTSYAMFVFNGTYIYVSEYGNHRVTKWTIGNNNLGQLMAGGAGAGGGPAQLNCPRGVYVDRNASLFVVDSSNHRVQQWSYGTAYGTTVAGQSGVAGSWAYQFNAPTAITFDTNGYMYILDAGNSRIQRWILGMTYGVTIVQGTMSSPCGMRWDFSNNLFVADTSNHRIISYNVICPPTTRATSAYPTLPPNLACQTGTFNATWLIPAGISSTAGTNSLALNNPYDVFVDGYLNMYVADFSNNRIQQFPPGITVGTTVAGFSSGGGSGYSQLSAPTSVFVDPTGAIYIADSLNYRVQKWLANQPLGFTVAGGQGNGAGLNQLGTVYSIFVDQRRYIYVSENTNHRVSLWSPTNSSSGILVAGIGVVGNSSVHLNSPWGLFVDSNYTLYIADAGNHRVQQWPRGSVTGTTVAGFTSVPGSNASLLNTPTAVTVDSNNYLYVMDSGNNRVQQFAPGSSTGVTVVSMTFSTARSMRLDSVGNLYIAEQGRHRILLFRCVYNVSTTTLTTATTTTTT